MNRKEHYNKQGLYNGYDKNNKEREALDYYSTPIEEVTNILSVLDLDLRGKTVLEPSVGGGHMLQGILDYAEAASVSDFKIIATDIQDRGCTSDDSRISISTGKEYDVLSDNYGSDLENIDYIIMNPPYGVIEPFVMKMLSLDCKKIIMLGRLQFLEGEKRFLNILENFPPTDTYVYVDRIFCYRNGNVNEKISSAQAYAWFVWDFEKENNTSEIHWIRRVDKKEK